MQLNSLMVFHLNKGPGHARSQPAAEALRSAAPDDFFRFETCQRWIWISTESRASTLLHPLLSTGVQVFFGEEAYRFLLQVATGLESEIVGETDVFGQLKEAWREFQVVHSGSKLESQLFPWVQRVFEDTKEIRSYYLQNLGGASYGTLTRKWLRQTFTPGPILLVGSGQIAQAIAPFLIENELWLANRSQSNLDIFYNQLVGKNTKHGPGIPGADLLKLECESRGWSEAAQMIVCVPFDPEKDRQRIQWFQSGQSNVLRRIMHLGGPREQAGAWNDLPQFHCLTELFQLQNSFGSIRSTQAVRAARACAERAQLRGLGTSLSICHGWEDLMCFA